MKPSAHSMGGGKKLSARCRRESIENRANTHAGSLEVRDEEIMVGNEACAPALDAAPARWFDRHRIRSFHP
jgi:hypothetical protein